MMKNKNWKRLPTLAGCLVAGCCIAACGEKGIKNDAAESISGAVYADNVPARPYTPEPALSDAQLDNIGLRHFAVYTDYVAVADEPDDGRSASGKPESAGWNYFACVADADM